MLMTAVKQKLYLKRNTISFNLLQNKYFFNKFNLFFAREVIFEVSNNNCVVFFSPPFLYLHRLVSYVTYFFCESMEKPTLSGKTRNLNSYKNIRKKILEENIPQKEAVSNYNKLHATFPVSVASKNCF